MTDVICYTIIEVLFLLSFVAIGTCTLAYLESKINGAIVFVGATLAIILVGHCLSTYPLLDFEWAIQREQQRQQEVKAHDV